MTAVIPLFLVAPLLLVPLGYGLLGVAAPGSEPPRWAARMLIPAAILLAIGFALPRGAIAAVFAVPWLAVIGSTALAAGRRLLTDADRFRPSPRHATDAAVAFLAVGATFTVFDRLGFRPMDIPTTIVLLTAVHFHFAGFVLPLAGVLTYARRPSRWIEVALGLVVVGIPTTALGFIGVPYANWVGALLTASGGLAIGLATLAIGRTFTGFARPLALLAGLSLLVSMPMAAVYATATQFGIAWLDIDAMANVHGGLNALGFATPVILAWSLDRRTQRPAQGPADPLDVMAFNAAPFIVGPTAAITGGVLLATVPLSDPIRLSIALGVLVVGLLSTAAIVAVVWVFAGSAGQRWGWVRDAAGQPGRWLNLTTGFDDSTARLRELLPTAEGQSIDLFDEGIEHASALGRARLRFEPPQPSIRPNSLRAATSRTTFDIAFMLMAAHEVHEEERHVLFATVADLLAPSGQLIVVEHLRDSANTIAFGPGARHFQSRSTWVATAAAAGLTLATERGLSPFVRGFVFIRAEP